MFNRQSDKETRLVSPPFPAQTATGYFSFIVEKSFTVKEMYSTGKCGHF